MASAIPPLAPHTVLVVEDESALRLLVVEMLDQDGGFRIIEAENADDAVDILAANADVACVFTDVKMPGRFDGIDLTKHVLSQYPAIKVMMTSGHYYLEQPVHDVPFLSKPYDLFGLPNKLRSLIAS